MTGTDARSARARLRAALLRPVDIASLVTFRALFGALMLISVLRFWARGWIAELYVEPAFHFTYWGFDWVRPWPGAGMYAHFAALAGLALCVALGLRYRVAMVGFFLAFTYVELLEKAAYLNHYYFISALSLLMIAPPAAGALSLDARRDPTRRRAHAPAFMLWALRLQVALVYVYAGVAKLNADWLGCALPLSIWLKAHTAIPLVGPWLGADALAYAMSLAGAAFDLTIPLLLLLLPGRLKLAAYACALGFHTITGLLFPIGMFPWIMSACALLLLPPDWPRALPPLARALPPPTPATPEPLTPARRVLIAALALHLAIQLLLPWRHLLYPGDVAWNEEGGRFAWRVMLVEKVGSVTLRLRDPVSGRRWTVHPEDHLTPLQAKEMSVQPDMILAFARWVAARHGAPVEVRADALVTMNGRPAARLVDPARDLARERDTLRPKPWILPAPRAAAPARCIMSF
ncbi:MAG: HTTM domain-containing protein [Myxococcales bacterium]|nr:HTTM domain-containing protein [Myxococcales bacterium]